MIALYDGIFAIILACDIKDDNVKHREGGKDIMIVQMLLRGQKHHIWYPKIVTRESFASCRWGAGDIWQIIIGIPRVFS